jgi:PAS domain S-box-containing protein
MGGSLEAFVGDLQRRNKTLSLERRKQADILESISDGVIAVNKNQEIVLINAPAAALVGKKPEELTGKSMPDAFAIMHNEQAFRLVMAKPGVFHYDDLILPHGEKPSYLELVVVVTEAMSDIAAIITVHDLTQGRELEVMKLDFVAIAAHELRTPLTVVRGYLDLISSSSEVSKLTLMNIEYLQRALSGMTQLGNLINNILNVSRIERGALRVKLSKVDITRLIRTVIEQQQVGVALRRQHIQYQGPSDNVFVAADKGAITEVVNNLLSNAIKYTSENGHISIRVAQTGSFVRIEVVDDGRGIPEASKAHLFTKFYRVENSLTTGNRGTGLGLYISKSIIALHHGEIGVVSKLGEGSTFFFTLPVFDEGEHPNINAEEKELDSIHGWFPKRPTS